MSVKKCLELAGVAQYLDEDTVKNWILKPAAAIAVTITVHWCYKKARKYSEGEEYSKPFKLTTRLLFHSKKEDSTTENAKSPKLKTRIRIHPLLVEALKSQCPEPKTLVAQLRFFSANSLDVDRPDMTPLQLSDIHLCTTKAASLVKKVGDSETDGEKPAVKEVNKDKKNKAEEEYFAFKSNTKNLKNNNEATSQPCNRRDFETSSNPASQSIPSLLKDLSGGDKGYSSVNISPRRTSSVQSNGGNTHKEKFRFPASEGIPHDVFNSTKDKGNFKYSNDLMGRNRSVSDNSINAKNLQTSSTSCQNRPKDLPKREARFGKAPTRRSFATTSRKPTQESVRFNNGTFSNGMQDKFGLFSDPFPWAKKSTSSSTEFSRASDKESHLSSTSIGQPDPADKKPLAQTQQEWKTTFTGFVSCPQDEKLTPFCWSQPKVDADAKRGLSSDSDTSQHDGQHNQVWRMRGSMDLRAEEEPGTQHYNSPKMSKSMLNHNSWHHPYSNNRSAENLLEDHHRRNAKDNAFSFVNAFKEDLGNPCHNLRAATSTFAKIEAAHPSNFAFTPNKEPPKQHYEAPWSFEKKEAGHGKSHVFSFDALNIEQTKQRSDGNNVRVESSSKQGDGNHARFSFASPKKQTLSQHHSRAFAFNAVPTKVEDACSHKQNNAEETKKQVQQETFFKYGKMDQTPAEGFEMKKTTREADAPCACCRGGDLSAKIPELMQELSDAKCHATVQSFF